MDPQQTPEQTSNAGAPPPRHARPSQKTPMMAPRRCCRHQLLFFKIKVRPGSCRSYPIWRHCNGFLLTPQHSPNQLSRTHQPKADSNGPPLPPTFNPLDHQKWTTDPNRPKQTLTDPNRSHLTTIDGFYLPGIWGFNPLRFENPTTTLQSFPQKTPKDPSTNPIICTSNEIPTSETVW